MTGTVLLTTLAGAAATAILAVAYRALWFRYRGRDHTPSGFGLFLAPMLLAAAWLGGSSRELTLALAIATLGTFIYWFDDLMELRARFRVALSFAVGAGISLIFLIAVGLPPTMIVLLAICAGIVNVALVNLVNFMDGADLNLATFILLTAALLILYGGLEGEWAPVGLACLAFTMPFAIFNSRPRTIYLGDAGSFAFATLFTILGVAFTVGAHPPPPEAAIPSALPLVDTFFVTALRIRIGHRFTERHYFHLYQRLQRDRPGFAYLLPQLVAVALCLLLAGLLQQLGLERFPAVAVAMAVGGLGLFLAWRRLFVTGEPGPPLPKAARA